MSIFFYPAFITATTDVNGLAQIQFKVPGTFTSANGLITPPPDGRYLKKLEIWTESGANGDKLSNISIKDIDSVIPAQLQSLFPNYPVIQYLYDTDVDASNGGIKIPPSQIISIDPFDPALHGIQFIPAGLYICADFTAAGLSIGKVININLFWGKYFTPLPEQGGGIS